MEKQFQAGTFHQNSIYDLRIKIKEESFLEEKKYTYACIYIKNKTPSPAVGIKAYIYIAISMIWKFSWVIYVESGVESSLFGDLF